jgi:hypothetical protein
MSIGNDKAAKKHRAKNIRETSSPGKIYQSRASKPSGVAALAAAGAAGTDAALIDAMAAKIDEMLAALKK